MKYLVMLGDGMADYPCPELDGKTPLEAAHKPCMDRLAGLGYCATVMTVPEGMVPESDTANLAVLGYDPRVFSKGRSPLEATSMGLEMRPHDTAFRTNVVTLSDLGEPYEDKIIIDHSSGEISTEEARELVAAIDEKLGDSRRRFFTGVSYRHCMLWENAPGSELSEKIYDFSRPHDILGKRIGPYLPSGEIGGAYRELMEKSFEILKNHPVNLKRVEEGKRPANSVWFWSPGVKPSLENFGERFGLKATVICAVDLIKGIGLCAGMEAPKVEGATGAAVTDFAAKGRAAVEAFENGSDFVYIHVEAPDECGHQGNARLKVSAIERIDADILSPVLAYLEGVGEPFRVLLMPDHPTPVSVRTHTREPVPFVIYDSRAPRRGAESYSEKSCAGRDYYPDGTAVIKLLLGTEA